MVAEKSIRHKKTARELVNQLGVSQSTVRRLMTEPLQQYLVRANTKSKQVAELRDQGLSVRAIAKKLEISKSSVGRYVQEYGEKR